MKNFLNVMSLLLLLGLSTNCENYVGDEVLIPDINLPSSEQFVLQAYFTTADSIFVIRADRARNVFSGLSWNEQGQIGWPVVDEPDLDIRLFDADNTELLRFDYIPQNERDALGGDPFDPNYLGFPDYTVNNNYRARFTENPLRPGETYRLQVNHPELGVYEILQTVPFPTQTASVELGVPYEVINGGTIYYQPFKLNISVPIGEERYFEFYALEYNPFFDEYQGKVFAEISDPRVIFLGKSRRVTAIGDLFLKANADRTDEVITLNMNVNVGPPESSSPRLFGIRLVTISKEWYDFAASLIRFDELRPQLNEGFVEPFQLYTNVPGGFGFFGVGTVDTVFVE